MKVSGVWIDEVWPDREPTTEKVEFEPRVMGALLCSRSAFERGGTTVHAAPLERWRSPHGDMVYPRMTSLCGVRGGGESAGPVTCGRCLAILGGTK